MALGTGAAALVVSLVWFTLFRMGKNHRWFDEAEPVDLPVTQLLPWSVLTRPSDAFQWGFKHELGERVYLTAAVVGLTKIAWPFEMPRAEELPVIALTVVFSSFMSIVALEVLSYVFLKLGKLLGGSGNQRRVRSALAWSGAVAIVTMPTLFTLATFEHHTSGSSSEFEGPGTLAVMLSWLTTAASLWTTAVLVLGISAAHRFSKTRALLTLAIPWAILIATCIGTTLLSTNIERVLE